MVLGRLEPESFAALVASEQPVCRGNRGGLPRTNEAPLPPLRRIGWLHGLGCAARSVPLLRGSVAGSPSEMGQALPYWQLYVADSMEPAAFDLLRLCSSATPSR